MNKFKKATKKISAVAAAAAVASATAFGSLGDYPSNFVSNGQFDGQVVVGADAAAIDSSSANSIISELSSHFSGDQDRVEITYRESGSSDEEVEVRDSGSVFKYGETLGTVRSTSFFENDFDILSDSTFSVGSSNQDVEQEISLGNNGEFEHALRDRLSDDISSHVFIDRGNVFNYTVRIDSFSVDSDDREDFLGSTMELLGNEYTVVDATTSTLKLLGGASKVAIGEGDSTTVSSNGNSYDVSVLSVSDDRVLVEVDGQTQTVRLHENDEVGGVNIAVTDSIQSSRDSVQGYAEIVIGGDEILLTDNAVVEMNGENIDDVYEDYRVTSHIDSSTSPDMFNGFTLEYSWEGTDGIVLKEGNSYEDRVFNAFSLRYDGMDEVDYEELSFESSGEWITLSGETQRGDSFSENVVYAYEDNAGDYHAFATGRDDVTPSFYSGFDSTNVWAVDLGNDEWSVFNDSASAGFTEGGTPTNTNMEDADLIMSGRQADVVRLFELADTGVGVGNATSVLHMKADGARDGVRFLTGDQDNQYLYEITRYSTTETEYTFRNVLDERERTARVDQVAGRLNDLATFDETTANDDDSHNITQIDSSSSNSMLAFANELLVDLNSANSVSINDGNSGSVDVQYDEDDITEDSNGDAGSMSVSFTYDDDDREMVFGVPTFTDFVNVPTGARSDISSSNSDVRERVDAYGTKVRYDHRDGQFVNVHVPTEQVQAHVSLVSGSTGGTEHTVTVNADEVSDKRAELEDDGYTIVGTRNVESEDVEFDISAPVMDSDVSEMEDLIVVGGPAVNSVAAQMLGMSYPTYGADSGVDEGEAVVRYFSDSNSVLVYGYEGEDTQAAVTRLNEGGLSGDTVNVE